MEKRVAKIKGMLPESVFKSGVRGFWMLDG
jgi:hypothetical protein